MLQFAELTCYSMDCITLKVEIKYFLALSRKCLPTPDLS